MALVKTTWQSNTHVTHTHRRPCPRGQRKRKVCLKASAVDKRNRQRTWSWNIGSLPISGPPWPSAREPGEGRPQSPLPETFWMRGLAGKEEHSIYTMAFWTRPREQPSLVGGRQQVLRKQITDSSAAAKQ